MRLTDEFEGKENRTSLPVVYMLIGTVTFIILLVCIVLAINTPHTNANGSNPASKESSDVVKKETVSGNKGDGTGYVPGGSGLTSDDLDFWDMYKEDDSANIVDGNSRSKYEDKAVEVEEDVTEEDPTEGGTKTDIVLPDGSEQWIAINNAIAKNTYDFSGLVFKDPVMKYYADAEKKSFLGVSVSVRDGAIDYPALKEAGVDYVMVQLLSRGYQSGKLTQDENGVNNLSAAEAAGMSVGTIVDSQAVTVAEAEEEANQAIALMQNHTVDYPVVYKVDWNTVTSSRISGLTKEQMSAVADAFCKKISAAGYTPVIYGNKYWLLSRLELTKLAAYEVWYEEEADVPDYPYQFTMWNYDKAGTIGGMEEVQLSISFVDYKGR